MFNVMDSRWFYLSKKALIGYHPSKGDLVLVVRQEKDLTEQEIQDILNLNKVEMASSLLNDKEVKYYKLKEVIKDDKAITGGVRRGGNATQGGDGGTVEYSDDRVGLCVLTEGLEAV